MRLLSLLTMLTVLAACNPQNKKECGLAPSLDELHTKIENVNKSIDRGDYGRANDELDRFFQFYKNIISNPELGHVANGNHDDSGMKLVHAEIEIKRGNLRGGVIEKLSIARGDLDYFTHICKNSDDEG